MGRVCDQSVTEEKFVISCFDFLSEQSHYQVITLIRICSIHQDNILWKILQFVGWHHRIEGHILAMIVFKALSRNCITY